MAEIAKSPPAGGELSIAQIASFAEGAPTTPAILGWLAGELAVYVYLARADGTPTLHAGVERDGEPVVVAVPGEEFSLCAVGSIDPELLSHVALIVSSSMARERAETMVQAKSQGDLVRSLLTGESDAVERAVASGWELEREVFVIIARFDVAAVEEIADEWRKIIKQRDPKGIVAFFPSEIVAVMSKDSLVPRAFAESLPHNNGLLGVSKTGIARNELAELYRQADLAITVAKSIGKVEDVFSLDDLGAYRLLALINDAEAIENFLNDSLKDLTAPSDLEAADLRRTLQALLDNNLNIAEAARSLHFHYNTLRYRITKLEKMLGPFTSDPELRLSLSLALRLFALRSNS